MDFVKIGKFIKKLREELEMSQNDLAKKLYVEKSNVSRWEAGKSSISANNLLEVSRIFQVSLDELVAGRRFSAEKKNEENTEKQRVLMDVIDNRNSLYGVLKKIIKILMIIVVIFLGYFFYTFYNSVSVYSIHSENNKFNIKYGSLTKMRDRIYFYLELDYDNQDLENVLLYYDLNGEKKEIIRQNNLSSIRVVDYYGYEEYFDFKNFDKIIKNMYLEIRTNNGEFKNFKLSFDRNYANINFFLRNEKANSKLNVDNLDNNSSIKIQKDIETAMNILNKNIDSITVNVDGIKYEVFGVHNGILVSFIENNFEFMYYYTVTNDINFVYKKLVNKKWENIYSVNVTLNKCDGKQCSQFSRDYDSFVRLINKIIIMDKK